MKRALLLIAHGSRNAQANAELFELATALRGEYEIVEPAFLELAEPTIDAAANRCVESGAERVLVVPYFLSEGVHVDRDLTDHCERLAAAFPAVEWRLARPMGRHPLIREVILDRAKEVDG